MITQIKLELLKLVRSKSFYLSFAALSAFVLLMLWGFYSYAQQKTNGLATEQMSGGATRKRIGETLVLVDLLERAHDPVRTYSHGMRQRLGLAQALLPNPELVILDEPTDGLDPQGIREIRLLLPRLRDELGLTILLSSHLLQEVERICNAVAIIDQGRCLYQGAIGGLLAKEKVIKITVDPLEEAYRLLSREPMLSVTRNGSQSLYVRVQNECIPSVNALLVANDIRVMELAPQCATLEEVFLRLTGRTGPAAD